MDEIDVRRDTTWSRLYSMEYCGIGIVQKGDERGCNDGGRGEKLPGRVRKWVLRMMGGAHPRYQRERKDGGGGCRQESFVVGQFTLVVFPNFFPFSTA